MTEWLPICRVTDGSSLGWIKPEMVVAVGAGSGQRTIYYRDGDQIKLAQRPYDFPDDEFMRRLGLLSEPTIPFDQWKNSPSVGH